MTTGCFLIFHSSKQLTGVLQIFRWSWRSLCKLILHFTYTWTLKIKPTLLFIYFSEISTRPWICKQMVNYYSSANAESPQHFILLQMIMIWTGQVLESLLSLIKEIKPGYRWMTTLSSSFLPWIPLTSSFRELQQIIYLFFISYLDPRFFYYQSITWCSTNALSTQPVVKELTN